MISKLLRIIVTLAAIGVATAVVLSSAEMCSLLPDKYNITDAAARQRVKAAKPQAVQIEEVDSLTEVDTLPQIDSLAIDADSLTTEQTIIE